MVGLPLTSPLFPYTTLFRSCRATARSRRSWRTVFSGARSASAGGKRALSIWAAPVRSRPVETESAPAQIESALRSEEHTSELQSLTNLVCRLLLEKKNLLRR